MRKLLVLMLALTVAPLARAEDAATVAAPAGGEVRKAREEMMQKRKEHVEERKKRHEEKKEKRKKRVEERKKHHEEMKDKRENFHKEMQKEHKDFKEHMQRERGSSKAGS